MVINKKSTIFLINYGVVFIIFISGLANSENGNLYSKNT